MNSVGNARNNPAHRRALAHGGDDEPAASGEVICGQIYSVSHQISAAGGDSKRILS
jgi:hypothetical protein